MAKGVSQIVSVIILVAIVVATGSAFFYFSQGLQSWLQRGAEQFASQDVGEFVSQAEVLDDRTSYNATSEVLTVYIKNTGSRPLPILPREEGALPAKWILYDSEWEPICSVGWEGICFSDKGNFGDPWYGGGISLCSWYEPCDGACSTDSWCDRIDPDCETAYSRCGNGINITFGINSTIVPKGWECQDGAWACSPACTNSSPVGYDFYIHPDWNESFYCVGGGCGKELITVNGITKYRHCFDGVPNCGECGENDINLPADKGLVCGVPCQCELNITGSTADVVAGEIRRLDMLLSRSDCDVSSFGPGRTFFFTINFGNIATASGSFKT